MNTTLSPDVIQKIGIKAFIKRRPLLAYFVFAFAGMWAAILPLVLSSLGMFSLPDAAALLLFVVSTYSGPSLAAIIVTRIVAGRAGTAELLRRCYQWRVGIRWYAVALFTFLGVWLLAYSLVYKGAPLVMLWQNWPLIFSVFLPNVALGIIIPALAEEIGWRGFALPRLQRQYGPIWATIILGTLHGLWHLPAFFTPLLGPFSWDGFIGFVITAAAATFIYTWLFNNTCGSVLLAILLHAASNAATNLLTQITPNTPLPTFGSIPLNFSLINVIAFSLVAIVLIVFTKGSLSYQQE